MSDYKKSLNLPDTSFPMKANLTQREPEMLRWWEENNIYGTMLEASGSRGSFRLHDGPPYANGHLHLGHALNKILKDITIKSRNIQGQQSVYVPGWDCHGLPIELKVEHELGEKKKEMPSYAVRRRCRQYADKFIDIQRKEFKRLGVLGDWDHPYKTMLPEYESATATELANFVEKGNVVRSKKPIYWCCSCQTALAEAEVEYADHKSPSIYVRFPLTDDRLKTVFENADPSRAYVIIWTTTPWTLPSNMAVALHPEFEYSLVEYEGSQYVLATELVESVAKACGWDMGGVKAVGTATGQQLELVKARHPFYDRESPLILGGHVTLDAGTGCVHTAPGFGADDFIVCQKYNIPIMVPVDGKGRHTAEAGKYEGMFVDDSNEVILKDLDDCGALLATEDIVHSYPHCWRCKNPIIFRTTEQWFCSVDALKDDAVKACEDIKWIPGWGQERMTSMIRERSDWCISRQRVWGVPIPIFTCKDCGKPLVNEKTIKAVADLFREKGSNAWFDMTAEEILPAGTKCECGCASFDKETDTMDVWFDSGSSWRAVIENREGQKTPVEVYLEGNDQYRGWFQSSMLTSIATQGKAPYKTVITHGMIVDEERQKMSKSLGNGIAPEDILNQYGADVMRLWVASSDYRQDMRISKDMLKHLSQNYLKIRNTARYILGNLADFDPKTDAVAYADLTDLDKWALMKLNDLVVKVREGYDSYEFHTVFHAIHNFCVVDMSNFYLDVIKDRLYCDETAGVSRRAAQTTIYRILSALVRMLSPILCFTADEIWQAMPHAAEDDVRNVAYNEMPVADEALAFDEAETEKWNKLIAFRDDVNKALEGARNAKTIGKPLEAHVTVYTDADTAAFLNGCGQNLADLCIVSEMDVVAGEGEGLASEELPGLTIAVARAAGEKCLRCWKQAKSVGSDAAHPGLCARCAKVVG